MRGVQRSLGGTGGAGVSMLVLLLKREKERAEGEQLGWRAKRSD